MLFGLGLHTLIDGVALAASVVADAEHGVTVGLAGIGTFLAVALHKPLDAFALTSTMKASGWSVGYQNLVNFLFSLACPLGALLFYFGFTQVSDSGWWLGCGLAISAGFFVCIAYQTCFLKSLFMSMTEESLRLRYCSESGWLSL